MAGSPAHWPPLLAEALGEIESADSLVTWGLDAWGRRRIVGLRELRVAALLFACSQQQEESSASPDWAGLLDFVYKEGGLCASLLDLAVRFGHTDVARCLHQRGQRQKRALGAYDFQRVPTESLATLTLSLYSGQHEWFGEWRWNKENGAWEQERWTREDEYDERWRHTAAALAEPLCPWGHWAQGHWASDWNAAPHCARMLVDAPATRAALALVAEGVPLNLEEGAAVRLLDAALLLGEPGAAAALADRCGSRRPVRFWSVGWAEMRGGLASLEGHLRAGHRDLQALGFTAPAVAAAKAVEDGSRSLAQALSGLLGQDEPPTPLRLYGLALLRQDGAGTAVVKPAALDALEALGSPPPACRVQSDGERIPAEVSLLLFSCALGDERAATRLARVGSTFTGLDTADTQHTGLLSDPRARRPYFLRSFGLAPVARRLEVAEASLRQLFAAAARRSCCAIAATRRRGLPLGPDLLERVVGLAASWSDAEEGVRQEVQRLIGRDPLGDLAVAPCTRWSRTAPPPATVATAMRAPLSPPGRLPSEQLSGTPGGGPGESSPDGAAAAAREPPAEPRGAPSGEQPESSAGEKDAAMENEELGQALQESALEAVQMEQADIQRAVLLSKEEALDEPVYAGLVYALLRLNKHSQEMVGALLESEALRPCREQVAAAGCELRPAWAGGALLFVPMTPELYLELGLELSAHHVFILRDDVGHLQTALRAIPRSRRPQLHQDHRAKRYAGSTEGLVTEQVPGDGSSPDGPAPAEAEERSGDGAAAAADEALWRRSVGPRVAAGARRSVWAAAAADAARAGDPGAIFDVDLLCEYGIVVQDTFLRAPADELSAASSSQMTKSAPTELCGQAEEVKQLLGRDPLGDISLASCSRRP